MELRVNAIHFRRSTKSDVSELHSSEGAFCLGNHNLFIYLAPSDTLCHKVTIICLVLTFFWSIVFYCCLNSAFVLDINIIMLDQTIQFCLCSQLLFFCNKRSKFMLWSKNEYVSMGITVLVTALKILTKLISIRKTFGCWYQDLCCCLSQ